jgi:SRSO17 transposase
VKHYLRGLLQADSKNRERIEEVVPAANHQALPHLLSESAWEERAVLGSVDILS